MRLSLIVVICVILIGLCPAFAAVVVLGPSPAAECYAATILPADAARDAGSVRLCDEAIADPTADVHKRAATYVNRGDIKLRLADYKGAIDDADQGLALENDIGEAYVNRGAGMLGLMRCRDAVTAFDKGLELVGDRLPAAYFDRALARECLGNINGAYQDYKRSLELDPGFQRAADELKRFRVVNAHTD